MSYGEVFITSRRDGRMTRWLLDKTVQEIKDGHTVLMITDEPHAKYYQRYLRDEGIDVTIEPYYYISVKDQILRAVGFPHKAPEIKGYYLKLK